MVGVAHGGERHLGAAGAHGDAERGARGVRGRVGVAHHEALPLQDDGLRLVLRAGRTHEREPRGAQQAKRQHTGGRTGETGDGELPVLPCAAAALFPP